MASTSEVATESTTYNFKDVALEKFNQVKNTSKEYYDVSKNYVKENPLLSIVIAGTAILASLPLFFVLSTFGFILLVVGSIFFVVLSIISTIAGIVLFVPVTVTLLTVAFYYTLYYLAYNTYSKVSVILSEDEEASFSIKLVGDCLIKTVKEFANHIKSFYNKIILFVIEKLSVLKISEFTKNFDFEGIKTKGDEVFQRIRNFRGQKTESSVPEELAKKEE
ncbi:hypothetical protein BCR36DRAFT_582835 [Piromyces finnis]|uniref:Uncharacterized protein n=1 Tax=Piromyces finnis TaxID=1754191 RepID=A0A1Y1VCG7_9FUNG|nr:hypothetical protein BCR36DRAFT_582835 [Piromyces finnis]|eukprot:ORX51798.1 hypothetical protein BCR36DRAFT_582835 [Piromyces finnis]